MPYKNPEDQRKASAEHYKKHREQYKERAKRRNYNQRKLNKKFIARVKHIFDCVDCGESDPIVLEFDHVKGKKVTNISDMAVQSYSIQTIKNEMRKCEIRCANCHRKKTYERRNS